MDGQRDQKVALSVVCLRPKKNAQLHRRSEFTHSDSILTYSVNIFVDNMATIDINRTTHVSCNTSAKRRLNARKCSRCPFLTDFDLFLGISSLIYLGETVLGTIFSVELAEFKELAQKNATN